MGLVKEGIFVVFSLLGGLITCVVSTYVSLLLRS